MSPFIQKFMLLCLLMLLCIHDVLGAHVNVTNSLKGNLDLTLHCNSGGPAPIDLGIQVLKPGASFDWKTSFEINGRYYYCRFKWNTETHEYLIYRVDRDTCRNCNWYITQSGPCKVQSPNKSICDSWNLPPM
ncbi:S-protein homolog 2-like [Lathyrus oleraceus]|uniref:S-protein homolog 2-like n=1 Tax=Pisum sativum TaxID=3888 RepID=UPI0021D25979|nr:S-protein homolog 2-like [Pisum sativum]